MGRLLLPCPWWMLVNSSPTVVKTEEAYTFNVFCFPFGSQELTPSVNHGLTDVGFEIDYLRVGRYVRVSRYHF